MARYSYYATLDRPGLELRDNEGFSQRKWVATDSFTPWLGHVTMVFLSGSFSLPSLYPYLTHIPIAF